MICEYITLSQGFFHNLQNLLICHYINSLKYINQAKILTKMAKMIHQPT